VGFPYSAKPAQVADAPYLCQDTPVIALVNEFRVKVVVAFGVDLTFCLVLSNALPRVVAQKFHPAVFSAV
jgi:hypothetical protein